MHRRCNAGGGDVAGIKPRSANMTSEAVFLHFIVEGRSRHAECVAGASDTPIPSREFSSDQRAFVILHGLVERRPNLGSGVAGHAEDTARAWGRLTREQLRDSEARRIVVDRDERLGDVTGRILRSEKSETACHYEGALTRAGCKSRPRHIPVATCAVRETFRRQHAA